MADFEKVNEVSGVFGGVEMEENNAGTIKNEAGNLPTKAGFWSKFKAFWLQEIDWNKEIKVVLTPYQQKVEDEKFMTFYFKKLALEKKQNSHRIKKYM